MVYSDTDIQIFHHPYFSLIQQTEKECELKSLNTGHYWKIVLKKDYCSLEHKHVAEEKYHHQTSFGMVELCLEEIANHDDFICRKHKMPNLYPDFFDYVVGKYKEN